MTPGCIAVCSVFAAHALANVVSETVLPERIIAAPATTNAPAEKPRETRSKDSSSLLARNMFCAGCENSIAPGDGASIASAATRLPLRLIATNISKRDSESFASVLNTHSQRQGAYRTGESIPGAGVVERIGFDFVDFRIDGDDQLQRVRFDEGATTAIPSAAKHSASTSGSALVAEYVRAISDTQFEVDRDLISKVRANPRLAGANARPFHRDGAMVGVQVSSVRKGGLAHGMGLRSGDRILAANGVKLTSAEAGLELLGQLGVRDHWSFEVERKGSLVQLVVDLR